MHYRSQSHVKAAKVAEIVTQLGFAACGVVCACVCWHGRLGSLCLPAAVSRLSDDKCFVVDCRYVCTGVCVPGQLQSNGYAAVMKIKSVIPAA